MVVTITRQYGAGGSRVAQLVAQALGWTVIDNEFVEAVASRAGLGWFGKNANLLLPGQGSWFILGAVITDAGPDDLTDLPSVAPVADGCGSCDRCRPACPTDAIVAPGVVDARRCLAWSLQTEGSFPREHRVVLGD